MSAAPAVGTGGKAPAEDTARAVGSSKWTPYALLTPGHVVARGVLSHPHPRHGLDLFAVRRHLRRDSSSPARSATTGMPSVTMAGPTSSPLPTR